jgi:DeoR family transcriptional regulator, suf operon transcriptional repressor
MSTTQPPSTKQDILDRLLKQGEATAHALARELALTPQAIRRHLKDLETDGLIQYRSAPNPTGRPNHVYELSKAGREGYPDRYHEFAVSLLDSLAQTVTQEQMSAILRQQWQRKAEEYRDQVGTGPLQERVSRLAALRRSEGYMAECHAAEPGAQGFVLTEYHCAISQIAESFPSVCGHELEMFELALQDCQVERTHWLADGEHRCGYLIQAR